jgi:hypothetical protein
MHPGEVVRSTISVMNETGERVHIEMSKKDWFVLPANSTWTVQNWLAAAGPTHFDLKAGEERIIPIEVSCPQGAQGELVAMVSFTYKGDKPSGITPMLSVSVYLSIAGTEQVAGKIRDVFIRKYPVGYLLGAEIRSTGNVHLRPFGSITVTDQDGEEVARTAFPSADPVYPGISRPFAVQDQTLALDPGTYTVHANFYSEGWHAQAKREFKVKADGSVDYQGKKSVSEDSVSPAGGAQ